MSQWTDWLEGMADELDDIVERLEEIQNAAGEWGLRGVHDKIEEGIGRIANAAEAARQGV